MPLVPNTRLGPYEILALLGEGGMGEVYRGRDTRLGRPVAIKVVHTEFSARFESEARAIAALNHPNICTLYDVGPNYLVMELVDGESLAARLRKGAVPLEAALRLAASIADALAVAHASGVVHRDLKPANVMITPDGRVKLLDFGLAKLEATFDTDITRTEPGAVMGTFAYMSPEQVQGLPADARSDIFAFGSVLHEMLAGERAFSGASAMMIAAAVVRDQPKPLKEVPAEVAAVVARCLRKDPVERYPRIAEAKVALEQVLKTGQSVSPASAASRSAISKSGYAAPAEPPSIAVLPFANLSGDKDNEYFSDGLAEEILNALARVPGLKVTARTSAFAFRGEKLDIRTIGQTLGVRAVLEGSVRRAGNRIRVTAQLVNASDGYQLWSARYDRDMTDVFAVQDEIAQSIVDTLKLKLAPEKSRYAVNMDAYHAYLKSVYHFFRINPEDLALAIRYAEEAAALDPDYAPAQVQRALCCIQLADVGAKPFREMMLLARSFAMKAVGLDASLPEAHAVLARVAGHLDYDWTEALRECRLALDQDGSASPSASLAITVLCPLRRFDEALAVCQKGIAADPLSPAPRLFHANVLAAMGSGEAAIQEVRGVLAFQDFHFAHYVLGLIHTTNGMTSDAIASLEKFVQLAPWNSGGIGLLAGNYAKAGETDRAAAALARLAAPEHTLGRDLGYVNYHVILDQFDRAGEEYERMIDARHSSAVFNSFIPLFEKFRQTPRGRPLMERMNVG